MKDTTLPSSGRGSDSLHPLTDESVDSKESAQVASQVSSQESQFALTEKRCGRCAETLPVDAFNKDRSRANGLQSFCRECQKGNYTRGENRQKALERSARYRAENPEKIRAQKKVWQEIKMGRMTRGMCEQCGKQGTDAHHYRGYDKPLDVQWLCRSCHVNLEPRRGAA